MYSLPHHSVTFCVICVLDFDRKESQEDFLKLAKYFNTLSQINITLLVFYFTFILCGAERVWNLGSRVLLEDTLQHGT
jgi:hypothetical protein